MADKRDEQTDPTGSEPQRGTPPGKPGGPDNNMKFNKSMIGWVLIVLVFILLFVLFQRDTNSPVERSPSDFVTMINNQALVRIDIRDDGMVEGTTKPDAGAKTGNKVFARFPPNAVTTAEGFFKLLGLGQEKDIQVNYKASGGVFITILLQTLPWILFIVVIWFFFLRQMRSAGGGIGMLGNFRRSRHRLLSKEHTNITFNDVAGIDEAKEELHEIVEFLKNPKRFQRLGGRIPRGVLLVGNPGVGKTLLAKAIAGEADVPFFSISGSDFVEMFVGVGASRVRDLFKTAKESSPCIIFLDEIDAVGRRRGNGMASGGHDEREQTLNAILVEMDGFDTNDQVIVIAATNRSDVLDPALTRPGRFDRQVYVPLPDIKGRYEILKVHAKKVKLSSNVDLMRLARQTPMFSGADLAAIINEAALMATMANKDAIEMIDLEESRDKLRFGKARKSRVIDEKDKIMLAWHEAGHAIMQISQPDADPLHKVTIIPRGPYGGASFSIPEKDRLGYTKNQVLAEIRILFGGRVAEELFIGDVGTGATNDIERATGWARSMVCDFGMSDLLGPIKYSPDERKATFIEAPREYSDKTAELIDTEVHRIVDEAYAETKRILGEKKEIMLGLKDALLKYETLDAEDVHRIAAGQVVSKPTVTDLLAQEQQRRAAEARREADERGETGAGPVGPIPQPG